MGVRFPEYKGLNLPKIAEELLAYWEENSIFEKVFPLEKENLHMFFLKVPRLPTDSQVYIMYLLGLSKIFFPVTKR